VSGRRLHLYHRVLNVFILFQVVAGGPQTVLRVLVDGFLAREGAWGLLLLLQEVLLVHIDHSLVVALPY